MEIKRVTVIGAGAMGSGIAQVVSTAGYPVYLRDVEERFLERALAGTRQSLGRLVKAGKIPESDVGGIIQRIQTTTSLEEAAREAQIVIEAVPEDLELKKQVFAELDAICPRETILATNTSQLSITAIASATQRRDRVVGMHWFNPAPVMRLIEIVRGLETSDATVETIVDLSHKVGKETVVCKKDTQGFITTRALVAFTSECMRIYEEGIASLEDIDKAIRLGLNHPMGPFELADLTGVDVSHDCHQALTTAYGDRFRASPTMEQLVVSGYYGRKAGRGFYRYGDK